ncbi:hypothetical protein ASD91_05235 [Pseudomonas sp. Root68]|uniref:hypothetical protein n=1 Tax=unclassified Pseudomonas TaxID=196821 RepID=UPI000701D64A|nr:MULTISPECIES: hypothetical protein [unclassified Pseudomonas]KRA95844.1 hypothetical protein ASD91_05235 [Pseudomonas sp. Root68]KRB66428.1 hypothetical protein ASD95_06495 [Pseudomonas sp. Root71]
MKKRKPNNMRSRRERASRALLNANHVAVVHIDPSGLQGMMNWKNYKSIPPGQRMAEAVCDFAHRWTIYVSVQCRDQRGHRYTKSVEVAPQGNYLAAHLEGVIEETYKALVAESNPNQRVASGWIAVPAEISLTEEQAARIFDVVGVWNQQRAA